MSQTLLRCIVVVCVALALLAAGCSVEASNSRPPRNKDISTMADALQYLQDLDSYYGDRARVRFGKRGGSLMQLLRGHDINSNQPGTVTGHLDLSHDVGEYPNIEQIF